VTVLNHHSAPIKWGYRSDEILRITLKWIDAGMFPDTRGITFEKVFHSDSKGCLSEITPWNPEATDQYILRLVSPLQPYFIPVFPKIK